MIRAVLLDLSGVLYQGSHALPGAIKALERLRSMDLALRFVTNTSRKNRHQVLADLRRLGFSLDENELFTAPVAAAAYVRARGLNPLLLVHPDIEEEFAGLQSPGVYNAVVLADAEQRLNYASLDQAFRLLMDGAILVAIGDNRYFRDDNGLHLDAGPFVRALEYASGMDAVVAGKPAATFFLEVLADLGVTPDQAVMVGDDVAADVGGAARAGIDGYLVRTGKYQPGDEHRLGHPVRVAADLAEVVELISREG